MPKVKNVDCADQPVSKKVKVNFHSSLRLSDTRCMSLTKEELVLIDEPTAKHVTFNLQKFIKIVANLPTITSELQKLKNNEPVSYWTHIGGNWYVSLNNGYKCVNIRKWFRAKDGLMKPTRTGISLRLREWEQFKENIESLRNSTPHVFQILPCYMLHRDQNDYQTCEECCPPNYSPPAAAVETTPELSLSSSSSSNSTDA